MQRDEEGYLCHLEDWDEDIAATIAGEEGIVLSAAHREIITALRTFYRDFGLSPAMRPLCKYLREQLGTEKSTSIYLMQLFPGSPARIAAKIAGLPKPDNCL